LTLQNAAENAWQVSSNSATDKKGKSVRLLEVEAVIANPANARIFSEFTQRDYKEGVEFVVLECASDRSRYTWMHHMAVYHHVTDALDFKVGIHLSS
jgi:hypothetical protein